MPEYLAPGVYVEEVSFRSKSIEGVSTTTTGFVGPTAYGPLDQEPEIITSLGEFELIYGGGQQLTPVLVEPDGTTVSYGKAVHNFMWHAARAFFEEGGRRLYVVRVFRPLADSLSGDQALTLDADTELYVDGCARASIPTGSLQDEVLHVRARFPGALGNRLRIRFTARVGQNILAFEPTTPGAGTTEARVRPLVNGDLVLISEAASLPKTGAGSGRLYLARSTYDTALQETRWSFATDEDGGEHFNLDQLTEGDSVRIVTLAVTVVQPNGSSLVWDGLAPDPAHRREGEADSLTTLFGADPPNRLLGRTLPIVITYDEDVVDSGLKVLRALFNTRDPQVMRRLADPKSSDASRTVEHMLSGGNDGRRPGAAEYEGRAEEDEPFKTGLKALEDIEDIAIVAAPGSTFDYKNTRYQGDANTVINLLIGHATRMRYRIAVIDSGDDLTIAEVRAMRARLDSKYAALYYPWVRILDPVTRTEIALPPSGFVTGIYARNDITRAVYKAPANEVVNLAIGFEKLLNKAQQEVLNPEGINCFRFFEGRGFRLWGARTVSSDPEWKYVNLRRYFAYLERSIDRGTQWAVFEPNGELLWANVRRTIEDFLLNEWQAGALLGDKPEKAYFVRCDRSTMTQNDLDNGRLICLIGVAPLRPAEFVIFRIGQWTADSKR